jgi:hypothetical protein
MLVLLISDFGLSIFFTTCKRREEGKMRILQDIPGKSQNGYGRIFNLPLQVPNTRPLAIHILPWIIHR